MKNAEIRALFQPFFVETRNVFQFLEHPYGYQRWSEEVITDHPYDWAGKSRYVRACVGVEIQWEYAESDIEVVFVELHQPGIFQRGLFFPNDRPDEPKAITLNSLAGLLGHGNDPNFLLPADPDVPDLPIKTQLRIIESRRHLIQTNLPGILAGLARATHTYATAILEGDTSMFPAVMDYHAARIRRRSPNFRI